MLGAYVDRIGTLAPLALLVALATVAIARLCRSQTRSLTRRRTIGRVSATVLLIEAGVWILGAGAWVALDPDRTGTRWGQALGLIAIGLWCAGLLWRGVGHLVVRRAIGRSAEASDEAGRALDGLLALGTRRVRRPALRVSPLFERPAVAGVWRPTIVLPATWEGDDSQGASGRLTLALAHELAHVRHGDLPWNLAADLAVAFWTFVPGVRGVARALRVDQEQLADQVAAPFCGGAVAYAAALLAAAGDVRAVTASWLAGGGTASRPAVSAGASSIMGLVAGSELARRVSRLVASARGAPTDATSAVWVPTLRTPRVNTPASDPARGADSSGREVGGR